LAEKAAGANGLRGRREQGGGGKDRQESLPRSNLHNACFLPRVSPKPDFVNQEKSIY
jgi:hypothetical protein